MVVLRSVTHESIEVLYQHKMRGVVIFYVKEIDLFTDTSTMLQWDNIFLPKLAFTPLED